MSASYHPRKHFPPARDGYKYCTKCEQEKTLDAFRLSKKRGKVSPYSYCLDCEHERDRLRGPIRKPRKTPVIPKTTQEGYKVCNTCLEEKPFGEFTPIPGGYTGRCKQCRRGQYAGVSDEDKEHRKANRKTSADIHRDEIRAADRARSTTDEHRAKRRERERPKREARIEREQGEKLLSSPRPPVLFKVCPRCVEKPVSGFSLDKNRSDGHYPICRECVAKENHANLEQRRAYQREKMLDPEYRMVVRQKINEWRRDNPLSQRELTLRRNARKKAATTEYVSYETILERDGMFCYICEKEILPDQKLEFDHVIPLIPLQGELQGTHSDDNIKPTHAVGTRRTA